MGIGDWGLGLGIGDWGLGIGDWGLGMGIGDWGTDTAYHCQQIQCFSTRSECLIYLCEKSFTRKSYVAHNSYINR